MSLGDFLENVGQQPFAVFDDPLLVARGAKACPREIGDGGACTKTPGDIRGRPNEKLLAYWDAVEDRLFKLRHCMNIEGVVRQLPLFDPPISPEMLVRARAAGVDLCSALADLNAPLPHYRFRFMLQKAYALCQAVRSLGRALLSALEKKDAEALAGLRAAREVVLLESVREVKDLAVDEARHSKSAAEKSLEVVRQRCDYYR